MDSPFIFDLSYYEEVNDQLKEIVNTEKEKIRIEIKVI